MLGKSANDGWCGEGEKGRRNGPGLGGGWVVMHECSSRARSGSIC